MVGASRHNVSSDLNLLWREGRAVKVPGRPVLYWDQEVYVQQVGSVPEGQGQPLSGQLGALAARAPARTGPDAQIKLDHALADPFERLIGSGESLRNQVEQAKAAVLYPPSGLHTLLVGPTGVGKSLMAELMHTYGLAVGKLAPHAPFVRFNCADYAHNPQLLMAHLFGVVKGAYTGADKERLGLVEQADGGLLFLDEVHRLPAEGQEMLFGLIDKGLFRRLGESGAERQARVMLVAATTERIDSALLHTFTRRIPMVIALPALADRTAKERFRFVRHFLREEAEKIGLDIAVPSETLRMLLQYECLGNIGQLRNDLKLTCARAFLNYLASRQEPIELVAAHLPEHIHRTLPGVRHQNPDVNDVLHRYGGGLAIAKRGASQVVEESNEGPLSFYGLLEHRMQDLQRRGVSPGAAERLVRQDVEGHFKEFLELVHNRHHVQRQELSKLVGQAVLQAVERAVLRAEGHLGRAIPERILYALALHVHSSLERLNQGRVSSCLGGLAQEDSLEARVAAEAVELIGRELGMPLPQSDVAFVSMLLHPEEREPGLEQVGVAVVAHGRGVASGMVEVAHDLTGVTLATAIDMSLDEECSAVEERLVALTTQGHFPGGLLLLVDMGSLERVGEAVSQRTGITVRTISMASSPIVLEAVHQASIPDATLDQVYQTVLDARSRALSGGSRQGLPPVIVTSCFTGSGSALTLAHMVEGALEGTSPQVEVISASMGSGSGWTRLVTTLLESHRLLAVVGPVNPRISGVPHISAEEMVVGSGGPRLRRLVQEGTKVPEALRRDGASNPALTIFDSTAAALSNHLVFTNPVMSVPAIARVLNAIETVLGRPFSDDLRVGLTMHLASLIEYRVRSRLMEASAAGQDDRTGEHQWLVNALQDLTSMFHVQMTTEDLSRVGEILKQTGTSQIIVS
ncbi:MAG: sigma-54-dependent transcriptional regulator [Symbiobacteriia bacterium]